MSRSSSRRATGASLTAPSLTGPSLTGGVQSRPFPYRRRAGVAVAASMLLAVVTGCTASSGATGSPAASTPSEGDYPVSVQNCGVTLTFDRAPRRVVSLAQPQTDLMVDLGLGDRVVGQAQTTAGDGLAGSAQPKGGEKIPVISADAVPTKEVTISQSPDLVLAPTTYEFDAQQGYATMEDLQAAGAKPYLAAGGCTDRRIHRSVDDTVTDIDNLGTIFGAKDRAASLAEDYRGQLAEVATALKGAEPVRVAEVYVWGSDIQSLVGSTENDLVRAAGGENVFPSDDARFKGKLFANLSAEVVAATQPDAFVFSAGSEKEADQARAALRKAFPSTPAVRNDRLIAYSSTASLPGSTTTPAAVRYVAQQLHPDAF